ncbi:hypothetical protein GDO78_015044 [Eleutherodactylus coqui]|uniref:Uncharacterized protein n=1 Tax=Eleutherodactylus coqui TaxID=57060 RepID=A0A8J6JWV6_ELECQ|nr:hypothetical protein GDO78_015044 [Eleutherodactylus coqui]
MEKKWSPSKDQNWLPNMLPGFATQDRRAWCLFSSLHPGKSWTSSCHQVAKEIHETKKAAPTPPPLCKGPTGAVCSISMVCTPLPNYIRSTHVKYYYVEHLSIIAVSCRGKLLLAF